MVRWSIYLPQQQLDSLRAESEKWGLSVAELVRRAIDLYLAHLEPRSPEVPSIHTKV